MPEGSESEVDPAEPDGDVVEGKRISVSPVTGAVYLVTRWVEAGDDGKMRAIEKRELEDHEISALSDDARAFIEEKREEGLGYDEDELVTDGGVSRDDLKECWCCDGLHDSPGTLCPNCDEAGCNRFTDECASDHKPALTDGGVDQSEAEIERWFVCVTCGCLKPEKLFRDGDCTCGDCYEKGNADVNWKEAPDGDGFVLAGDSA